MSPEPRRLPSPIRPSRTLPWRPLGPARRGGHRVVAGTAVVASILGLTALLALVGGPASHVSVLYLVPVAIAALVLGTGFGLTAVAMSVLCYALLFALGEAGAHGHDDAHGLAGHILGMWLATLAVAGAIALLLGRIARALREGDAELHRLQERAARHAHLVALSTLAAGAAHELGSPLATIAVAARELEHAATTGGAAAALLPDARLIRAQVERCREILAQLASDFGAGPGAAPEPIAPRALLDDVVADLPPDLRGRVRVTPSSALPALVLPRTPVARALASLVRNALDASRDGASVVVAAEARDGGVALVVQDQGDGMSAEVLARAGEPFFTTKPPGRGQGLGLFVARAVAAELGGSLVLESRPGRGTRAALSFGAGSIADAPHPKPA